MVITRCFPTSHILKSTQLFPSNFLENCICIIVLQLSNTKLKVSVDHLLVFILVDYFLIFISTTFTASLILFYKQIVFGFKGSSLLNDTSYIIVKSKMFYLSDLFVQHISFFLSFLCTTILIMSWVMNNFHELIFHYFHLMQV